MQTSINTDQALIKKKVFQCTAHVQSQKEHDHISDANLRLSEPKTEMSKIMYKATLAPESKHTTKT